jgi:beta-N-acetylhexosaminidase
MSTAFRPGHVLMVDIQGKSLDAETAAFLREHEIRAVCLFRHNIGTDADVRRLTADLRDLMGPHALIAIDQEGGSVIRVTSLPQPPAAMALGAIGDEALAQQVGAAVARGLRHLGINWNFAPVLDVNNNPANPVIGERSFSDDPDTVTRLGAAWMRGSLAEGVSCCVKHFPGHGDTHVDSHHALPVVDKSLAQLESLELRPFRALASGPDAAPAMMTAHIVYPQIDPDVPATLSKAVLTGLLRESIGYDGVVITDALFMQAIRARYGHARGAVMALQAGADMPLAQGSLQDQRATLEAIEAALADGTLDLAAMERARARLERLAARFPVSPTAYPLTERRADEALMRDAWGRALCAFRGARPPARDARLRVVTQARVDSDGVSEAGLSAEAIRPLFSAFEDVEFAALADMDAITAATFPRDGRFNVMVSNNHPRYPEPVRAARPDLHVALWNPFQVLDIDAPTIVTWGYADGAIAALKRWLEGRGEATAKPPVQLPAMQAR